MLLVGFYQAEVQDLDEIEVRTQTGDVYVGRFDVAVEEALLVSVTERMADLLQQEDGSVRWDGAKTFY